MNLTQGQLLQVSEMRDDYPERIFLEVLQFDRSARSSKGNKEFRQTGLGDAQHEVSVDAVHSLTGIPQLATLFEPSVSSSDTAHILQRQVAQNFSKTVVVQWEDRHMFSSLAFPLGFFYSCPFNSRHIGRLIIWIWRSVVVKQSGKKRAIKFLYKGNKLSFSERLSSALINPSQHQVYAHLSITLSQG